MLATYGGKRNGGCGEKDECPEPAYCHLEGFGVKDML